jgi:hypothetical protein
MSSKSTFPRWPVAAGLLLALLVPAPIYAGQYLTVTSSPDPSRIEPGVTTLKVQATTPALGPVVIPWTNEAYPPTFQVDAWFLKPGATDDGQASSWYFLQSPEQTAKPYSSITFSYKFPVPSDTPPGKHHASVALMGAGNTCCLTYEVIFLDIVPPKLHRGSGPVGHRDSPPIVSPPPVQKPPREKPEPYRPSEPAAGSHSRLPNSEGRPAGLSGPPRTMRSGERLTLGDGSVLVMRGSMLALLGPSGEVVRSYPPGAEAFVNAAGEVTVRSRETNEVLGVLRK